MSDQQKVELVRAITAHLAAKYERQSAEIDGVPHFYGVVDIANVVLITLDKAGVL